MANDHDKFGEDRSGQRKDQWGNTYHTFDLVPFKIERTCKCPDHTSITFSIEADVIAVSQRDALIMAMQGEEVPTKKDWVPLYRVQNQHN